MNVYVSDWMESEMRRRKRERGGETARVGKKGERSGRGEERADMEIGKR